MTLEFKNLISLDSIHGRWNSFFYWNRKKVRAKTMWEVMKKMEDNKVICECTLYRRGIIFALWIYKDWLVRRFMVKRKKAFRIPDNDWLYLDGVRNVGWIKSNVEGNISSILFTLPPPSFFLFTSLFTTVKNPLFYLKKFIFNRRTIHRLTSRK